MFRILKNIFKDREIDLVNPTFIGIGTSRSGTTWLARQLQKHPDVFLPRKQVHYFDREPNYPSASHLSIEKLYERVNSYVDGAIEWRNRVGVFLENQLGDKSLLDELQKNLKENQSIEDFLQSKENFKGLLANKSGLEYFFGNYNDAWYKSLFKTEKKVSGEITPSYCMLDEKDVKKVKDLLPDVKIIYIMRNPVDKAWSSFKFKLKNENINVDDLTHDEIVNHFNNKQIPLRDDYIRTLNNWEKYFDKSQMLVLFFDEIKSNPKSFFKKVCDFLDIDFYDTGILEERINSTNEYQMPVDIQNILYEKYKNQILYVQNRFGGYSENWNINIKEKQYT
ncbi:sulfotransferase [Aliarcobacter skirrowii]|uniref:sulfotransferase family protein n=1 Tax=Aliarcobacter skirrowii TaxID=28200 RepID=UPI0029BD495B|nr:sulfotransferase [Aliarcobacter skirrowii]MDX4013129.1 sulfotransferase [Aliarcobacter skirrowii]